MKDQATLLALGGVILITIAVIISSGIAKQAVDSEFVKLVATGLLGFAGGVIAAPSVK